MERIANILKLTQAKNLPMLRGFQQRSQDTFDFQTDSSGRGHTTWMWFEIQADFIRFEITHIFGVFDFRSGVDANKLVQFLSMNHPSFKNSCAYLAIVHLDTSFYASLQASQVFLSKWSDEDIAHALAAKLFDLHSGLIWELPHPIVRA
jgi:hypothetical protein